MVSVPLACNGLQYPLHATAFSVSMLVLLQVSDPVVSLIYNIVAEQRNVKLVKDLIMNE